MADEVGHRDRPAHAGRSRAWRAPAAIAALALLALYGAVNFGRYTPPEPLRLERDDRVPVPDTLADGRPVEPAPEALAARFDAPVVLAAEMAGADWPAICTPPSAPPGFADLIAGAGRLHAHVDPAGLSVLAVGAATPPPGFPDTYAASCRARFLAGRWFATSASVAFAGADEAGAGVPLFAVPSEARWVAVEQAGWWLVKSVDPQGWTQADAHGQTVRAVFLDEDLAVLADLDWDSQNAAPSAEAVADDDGEAQAEATSVVDGLVLDVGPVPDVLAAVGEQPLRRCAEEVPGLCVWITRVRSELKALAAFGPLHADVPPFGQIAYCPASQTLDGTGSGARFTLNGEAIDTDVAPRGLDHYEIRYRGERVVVDFGAGEPGPPPDESVRFVEPEAGCDSPTEDLALANGGN